MPGLEVLRLDLLAYGPAPGLEFLPYSLGLLAWVWLAILALVISPLTALIRRLRGRKSVPPQQPCPATVAPFQAGENNNQRRTSR